jgi:acetolactate synthase I/II/III large subunit
VHVDIDPSELNNKVKAHIPINSDVKRFLLELERYDLRCDKAKLQSWTKRILEYKSKYLSFQAPREGIEYIDPNYFMHRLSEVMPSDAIVCADVGQIQMWSAQSLEVKGDPRFLTQGGIGLYGLGPANGNRRIFCQA